MNAHKTPSNTIALEKTRPANDYKPSRVQKRVNRLSSWGRLLVGHPPSKLANNKILVLINIS